ncbi:putative E3 ubiquitin-protein ligase ATL45 [Senna tora]|uniref:RING-type E3 ubiquitin transferase n=1 Tax=Senna tora TaxID=362788 RepID=A0A834WVT6_9FABA|nr:putative E3 ubiquitin-protein ligase ATL45 [Senna tora]
MTTVRYHQSVSEQPEDNVVETFRNLEFLFESLSTESFNIYFYVHLVYSAEPNLDLLLPIPDGPLLFSCHSITCEQFFQEGPTFLHTNISRSIHLIPSHVFEEQIIPIIMADARILYDGYRHSHVGDHSSATYPLAIDVSVEFVGESGQAELDVLRDAWHRILPRENNKQEDQLRMTPAAQKVIYFLYKMYDLVKHNPRVDSSCCICLEEYADTKGAKVADMPCRHVFHIDCIVRWLETSRSCPLCRFELPRSHNNNHKFIQFILVCLFYTMVPTLRYNQSVSGQPEDNVVEIFSNLEFLFESLSTESFNIYFYVHLVYSAEPNLDLLLPIPDGPLLFSCHSITCEQFFQEGPTFLHTNISRSIHLIPSHVLEEQIIPTIMTDARILYDRYRHSHVGDHSSATYPLAIDVSVEFVGESGQAELDVLWDAWHHILPRENNRQEDQLRITPASQKAIDCLHTMNHDVKHNPCVDSSCCICLQEYVDDKGVEVSAMPCRHVYHKDCIVRWLKTSNSCPLCRFQMPISTNNNLVVWAGIRLSELLVNNSDESSSLSLFPP